MNRYILTHKWSGLYDGVYVGTLLNSIRAADVEIDRQNHWYIEGNVIQLKMHTCSVLGDGKISDPIQLLTDAFTQNVVWLTVTQHGSSGRVRLPTLASTSRNAILQAVPIELELVCKCCHQSPDFRANLEWGIDSLSRSKFALSIKNQLLHNAENTSTLAKVLPVNFDYRGEHIAGALQVNSTIETISSAILYVVTDHSTPWNPDRLPGTELKRAINRNNSDYKQSKIFESVIGIVA